MARLKLLQQIRWISILNLKNSDYEYVMALRNILDRKLFPSDFDSRIIEEQYTWINENIAELFPNVPKSLLHLISAAFRDGDCGESPVKIPEWLDMNKYRRGQKFVREHYVSIIFSEILAIFHVFSFNESLKPLIIERQTDTPKVGFQRYVSTARRIFSWYNGEPWVQGTSAYKDMQVVRNMHLVIRKKMCKLSNEQIDSISKITEPKCTDRELFLKDFAACPSEKPSQRPYVTFGKTPYRPKGVNAAEMAGTQCAFIGPFLICPQVIGIHDATDEDLDAICHMWRCYGYYLGIEEEYNFCRGSLDEVKQRTRDMYQYWVIPNFKDITIEWEHMTRCVVEPMNYYPLLYVPYKVMVLITMDGLNLKMPNLYASLSYSEWIAYKASTFVLRYGLKFSGIRVIFNKVVRIIYLIKKKMFCLKSK